jgi:hypothetical protein
MPSATQGATTNNYYYHSNNNAILNFTTNHNTSSLQMANPRGDDGTQTNGAMFELR